MLLTHQDKVGVGKLLGFVALVATTLALIAGVFTIAKFVGGSFPAGDEDRAQVETWSKADSRIAEAAKLVLADGRLSIREFEFVEDMAVKLGLDAKAMSGGASE